jgi:predicted ATPase
MIEITCAIRASVPRHDARVATPRAPFLHGFRLRAREVDDYTDELPALQGLERLELDPRVTFFVGENGSGKSTLVEALGESFLDIAVNRLAPNGLYLFDEPEAALSLRGQLALMRRMHELLGGDCQFVVATHSPILLGYPEATIYELSDDGIRTIEYDEAPQVELTRSFLDDPERFFRHLLA